jgi:hypothetical protein
MLNPTMKAKRTASLEMHHAAALTVLSSAGKTLATVAVSLSASIDDAEKKVSVLIDEGLATRTVGGRATALYTAV